MNGGSRIALVALAMAVAGTWVSVAGQGPHRKPWREYAEAPIGRGGNYGWTTEAWTGDNDPWLGARAELDKVMATSKDKSRLVTEALQAFDRNGRDPMLLYRWAYLAYKVGLPTDHGLQEQRYMEVRTGFCAVPSPRVSEFARLRFMIEAWQTPGMYYHPKHLMHVADRLLRFNPNDYVIKYYYASLATGNSDLDIVDKGMRYIDGLLEHFKGKPLKYRADLYFHRAMGYKSYWFQRRDKSDARGAVEAYRMYAKEGHVQGEELRSINWRIDKLKKEAGL